MFNTINKGIISLLILCSVSILAGQGIIWEENFNTNPGTWTLGGNWSITSGYLRLHYSPNISPYDMSAISPVIQLPNNVRYLHITQHIEYYYFPVHAAFEIAVLIDGIPQVLWVWDQVGVDWGVLGGSLLTLPLEDFQGEDIQLRFRSWGASTWYGINWWRVHHLAIESALFNDLEAISLEGSSALSVGSTGQYILSVQNNGQNAQTDYSVRLMKEGNIEIGSAAGLPIESDQTIDYTFYWTPSEADSTYLYGEVLLLDDENPDNNVSPNFIVEVYPMSTSFIQVGTGTSLGNTLPVSFYFRNSISQTIYMDAELDLSGEITHLTYYNSFTQNLPAKPIKIWMGMTTQNNLTNGWIPVNQQTLVFDGTVNFPLGENAITIPLQIPIEYTTGNVVITHQRPMDTENFNATNAFYYTLTGEYPNRSRNIQSLTVEYDPYDISGGFLTNRVPNTRFVLNITGVGVLSGYVYDQITSEPISGVTIGIDNLEIYATTNSQGFFSIGNVPEGTHNINASKDGYFDYITEVAIIEGEITTITFNLHPLPLVTVSGQVVDSSNPTEGILGALVSLIGVQNHFTETTANGFFSIPDVYSNNTYTIHINHQGYHAYSAAVIVEGDNLDLDIIMLDEIPFPPFGIVAEITPENNVEITWNTPVPPGTVVMNEFRYDDGIAVQQLGYTTGTNNSILGAAHRRVAEIHEITWYTTFQGGPHNTVNVFIFGLNASGMPDSNDILYQQMNVPNVDNTWTTHELLNPVVAQNGFLVGLSYNGYLGLAVDNGEGPPWNFIPNTQFAVYNYSDHESLWTDIATWNHQFNFLIRAYGLDFGPSTRSTDIVSFKQTPRVSGEMTALSTGNPISRTRTEAPLYRNRKSPGTSTQYNTRNNRSLEGYLVYRLLEGQEGTENLWAYLTAITSPTDTTHVDTQWFALGPGMYKFAVKAVYSGNVLSEPVFSNSLENDLNAQVTVIVTTNSGDTATGTEITLTNNNLDPDHIYSMVVPQEGVATFPVVKRGTYTLEASLAGFEYYLEEEILIETDLLSYSLTLIELLLPVSDLAYEVFNDNNVTINWLAPRTWSNRINVNTSNSNRNRNENTIRKSGSKNKECRILTGYKVFRNNILIDTLTPGTLSYTDHNLAQGYYIYGVSVQYTTGESEIVSTEEITILEIDQIHDEHQIVTALYDNFPNPFNPNTTIYFTLSDQDYVVLDIYNVKGQLIRTLVRENMIPGSHQVIWDGKDDLNRPVGGGIYFYRMKTGVFSSNKKMILLK